MQSQLLSRSSGSSRCAPSSSTAMSGGAAAPRQPSSSSSRPQQQQQQPSQQPAAVAAAAAPHEQQQPQQQHQKAVLLFDVMDTIVSDPFFEHMPRFFGLSFKELLASKHPTAWVEFENDLITQDQLFAKFFADGRAFDGPALVQHMVSHYAYIEGMPNLLGRLKAADYELHAISNYPVWYELIEQKLRLSEYLEWTFMSCTGPMKGLRKPAAGAYEAVTAHLQLPPQRLIFIDDRQPNVDAAVAAGMRGIKFGGSAAALERELQQLGLEF